MKTNNHSEIGWHMILGAIVFLMLVPIVFALSNSFKTLQDAFNTIFEIIPSHPTLENYRHVFEKLPFVQITLNTFLIAASVTTFKTITSLFAAYSFVYFDYKGKQFFYFIMLSTMFIPFTVTMIPNYQMISKLGLRDCIWGVALPQFADVLGIFLLRQAMRGIPKALIEAARMEGIGSLKIMRDIILPLVRPSILTTGIIFFINSWNEYVWPVLILKSKENYTLSLALQMYISAEGGTEFTIAMAVSVITMIIPLALYLIFQRYIINTFAEGVQLAKTVGLDNVKVLIDFYHMVCEKETPEVLRKYGKEYLRHVHFSYPSIPEIDGVRDPDNIRTIFEGELHRRGWWRTFPSCREEWDYTDFIQALKDCGYQGRVSLEAPVTDFDRQAQEALAFMKAEF